MSHGGGHVSEVFALTGYPSPPTPKRCSLPDATRGVVFEPAAKEYVQRGITTLAIFGFGMVGLKLLDTIVMLAW